MSRYQSPVDLPDEHMRLVGIIAAHWEWAELILQRAVAEVADHDWGRIKLLTENIGYRSKCDLLMIYARPLETEAPEDWKRFTKALNALNEAHSQRNAYVHAKWKVDNKTGEAFRKSVRTKGGKLSIIHEPVEVADLEKAADDIWDAAKKLTEILQEYGVLKS